MFWWKRRVEFLKCRVPLWVYVDCELFQLGRTLRFILVEISLKLGTGIFLSKSTWGTLRAAFFRTLNFFCHTHFSSSFWLRKLRMQMGKKICWFTLRPLEHSPRHYDFITSSLKSSLKGSVFVVRFLSQLHFNKWHNFDSWTCRRQFINENFSSPVFLCKQFFKITNVTLPM